MTIGEIISAGFQIITLPFRMIWENCKEIGNWCMGIYITEIFCKNSLDFEYNQHGFFNDFRNCIDDMEQDKNYDIDCLG